jgi:hypothetical protein
VDDNYPSFSISKDGTTYTFTGQIAIQNIDHSVAFSEHGDSGSVLINLNNKIVGLIFAGGRNVDVHGTQQPFISLANHISDVFSALNIHIEYSPDVITTAGETLEDLPAMILEAPVPEPYRALRERLQGSENTAWLFALGLQHSDEVMNLINHKRPVTVAWHRSQGPAVIATIMSAVRDGHYQIPESIKGTTPDEVLRRMRKVLIQYGSPALKETLEQSEADMLINACIGCNDLNEVIKRLAVD